MTGEITLRGRVLKIGGLKEKLLAANRGGVSEVVIPKENEIDMKEVPKEILKGLNVHAVDHIDEVLTIALGETREEQPIPPLRGRENDPAGDVTAEVDPVQTH